MLTGLDWFLALAEGEAKDPLWSMMPLMLVLLAVFYVIVVLPQQKEKNKRESMLNDLKKNDRVVTIGGIIGSIANVSPDGKEITLKVDDNTRIKFVRSGISHKLADEPSKEELPKPGT